MVVSSLVVSKLVHWLLGKTCLRLVHAPQQPWRPSFPSAFSCPSHPPFSLPLPPLPLEVGPVKSSYGPGERCELPQWGMGRSPNRNRNWCILALKYPLVATILIIFLRNNWPNLNFFPPTSSPEDFCDAFCVAGGALDAPVSKTVYYVSTRTLNTRSFYVVLIKLQRALYRRDTWHILMLKTDYQ